MSCKYCSEPELLVIDCTKRSYSLKPRISVVMCAYNNEEFIGAALDPLIENDKIDKIIVIEGAWNPEAKSRRSEDKTIEIISSKKSEKLDFYTWDIMDPEDYQYYQCDRHREILKEVLSHPYYHGPSLQQQLLARDFGLRKVIESVPENEDPGWLFIVDSDEVYEQGSLDNLVDVISMIGEEYDQMTINGMSFYFDKQHYRDEWYLRVFRLYRNSFHSNDCNLETPNYLYLRNMNIDTELCQFFHYGYIGKDKVKKKLEIWNKTYVDSWWSKNASKLTGVDKYNNEAVHLFGDINPGYKNYVLREYNGHHPKGIE